MNRHEAVRKNNAPTPTADQISTAEIPTPPDVATLLGTYFKQYTDAANAGAPSPFGLHASSVHASDVTVETAGNMALTWGRAYLPAALPAGVNLSEIK